MKLEPSLNRSLYRSLVKKYFAVALTGLALVTASSSVFIGTVLAKPVVAQVPSQMPTLVNEAAVKKIIDDIIAAAGKTKELDALLTKYVAPFAVSVFTAETSNQRSSLFLEGREELRFHMKQAYSSLKSVEYLDKYVTTSFVENGKVLVADIVSTQRITRKDGSSYISRNLAKAAFTMVEGELKVTSYIVDSQIDNRP